MNTVKKKKKHKTKPKTTLTTQTVLPAAGGRGSHDSGCFPLVEYKYKTGHSYSCMILDNNQGWMIL